MHEHKPRVAIVDYEMGNLFSVMHACEFVGLDAVVTASGTKIASADAVILPGVGAFPDAMATLRRLDLAPVLKDVAASGRPFLGICLGMQLLMTESTEFGRHAGLGLIPGVVEGFVETFGPSVACKIPHIGWNRMRKTGDGADPWHGTLMQGLPEGVFFHFVHSYHVRPEEPAVTIATTEYGGLSFCSAIQRDNVSAFQGHPERSGPMGLTVYRNLAATLHFQRQEAQ